MKALSREAHKPACGLVVDDEEKLGRFVCMLLKQMGCHAVTCQSIEEARRLLAQRQHPIARRAVHGEDEVTY